MAACDISLVETDEDLMVVKALIEAYTQSLGIDLTYQNHASEMANLPGEYDSPSGALLLARDLFSGEPLGCVAMRALAEDGYCEMKRLYVAPAGRRRGVGRQLAMRAVIEAKMLEYRFMRLDTLSSMKAARTLYEDLGFRDIEAYYETPVEDTIFMEVELSTIDV